jgi:hypothetical protein
MKRLLPVALTLLTLAATASYGGEPFNRKLELQGIRFHLTSNNQGSVNKLRIVPSGRLSQRTPITQEVYGTVTGAEIADLNADGWPEIYVYISSAGSGSYGTVVGYAVNRGKSVTPITLPELSDDPVASAGYQGHDEFALVEGALARRFPVYRSGDTNASPSGGRRQLHYRLVAGEAGWLLRLNDTRLESSN